VTRFIDISSTAEYLHPSSPRAPGDPTLRHGRTRKAHTLGLLAKWLRRAPRICTQRRTRPLVESTLCRQFQERSKCTCHSDWRCRRRWQSLRRRNRCSSHSFLATHTIAKGPSFADDRYRRLDRNWPFRRIWKCSCSRWPRIAHHRLFSHRYHDVLYGPRARRDGCALSDFGFLCCLFNTISGSCVGFRDGMEVSVVLGIMLSVRILTPFSVMPCNGS
jgi:hypothetical protein